MAVRAVVPPRLAGPACQAGWLLHHCIATAL